MAYAASGFGTARSEIADFLDTMPPERSQEERIRCARLFTAARVAHSVERAAKIGRAFAVADAAEGTLAAGRRWLQSLLATWETDR